MLAHTAGPFIYDVNHGVASLRSRKLVIPDREKFGGARRDRTDDLMLAKHALYQLSYGPCFKW